MKLTFATITSLTAAASLVATINCAATVLTFDVTGISNGLNINQSYGDNVTAITMGGFSYGAAEGFTPDVTVLYGDSDPSLWTTGYGNLTNVLYENQDTTGILNLTFTASAGFSVRLHNFSLAAFGANFASDPTITSVKVFDSANTILFSQTNPTVSETTSTAFNFSTPLEDDVLRVEIDARNLGGLNDDIAIDNVTFSQVPEPASMALLTLGGTLCFLRRGRHSRSTVAS